jgi:membrane fusion protein, multidrug efflux system
MKNIFIILISAMILASCGKKEGANSLEHKKTELADLKKSKDEISTKIKALEDEIAKLDTTAKKSKFKDVQVTTVLPVVFRHFIDVQGQVDAEENVSIQPTVPGLVKHINVNEGDMVKAGQILGEIDNDIYVKQLNSIQPQLTLANELFDRQKRLWDQKIGSEVQFLQAKTQKEYIEKQIETLQEQIDMTRIKSPISGTVDHVGIKIGQLASAMSMDPAFRVVNLSTLKVKGEVAESYSNQVKKGNAVTLFFPDLNKEIKANISYAAKVINTLTRTFTTEAIISGDNSEYRPNMTSVMKIIDYEKADAIVLPINVIQNSGTSAFVYVAVKEGDKMIARRKDITIGITYNGQAEITSGLMPNDQVVTTGQLDITDGMEIKF